MPSRWRSSSTIVVNSSLQKETFSAVISVTYLSFTPLSLASWKAFFNSLISTISEGLVWSTQASILFFALEANCNAISITLLEPYDTLVFSKLLPELLQLLLLSWCVKDGVTDFIKLNSGSTTHVI